MKLRYYVLHCLSTDMTSTFMYCYKIVKLKNNLTLLTVDYNNMGR